jgi:2-hydroxy-3-oxopropionate reductase
MSIMVGGPADEFERARPLFDVLGKTVVRVGEAGAGQTAKACNQILVAVTIEAVSEALVLASKAGVDPERLIEVLSGGLAGSDARGPASRRRRRSRSLRAADRDRAGLGASDR